MRLASVVALAASLAACVSPDQVVCGDGRVCPGGTTCDDVRGFCLSEAQTTACDGVVDGQPCDAAGVPGICERRYCEPGCGDGVTDPDEQCDDGNFASHDGCSSACAVEIPTWTEVRRQWEGTNYGVAAYDAAIGTGRTVVLNGVAHDGLSARIWQHDPTRAGEPEQGWREVTDAFAPDARPPATLQSAAAYDSARGVLVVYGGAMAGTVTPTDTWEYVPSANTFEGEPVGTWRKVTTPTNPGGRYLAALAYDPEIGATVLFGGVNTTMPSTNATWAYDGTDWRQLTVTGTPPTTRIRHALVFDETRQKLVLYGGSSVDTKVYELAGGAWTTLTPTSGPGARRNAAVGYDPVRGTVVLFGGQLGSSPDIGSDTWEWNGTAWLRINGPRNPPARRAGLTGSEPTGLLLVGGALIDDSAPLADAWSLENAAWVDRSPRFQPSNLNETTATYVPGLGVVTTGGIAGLTSALVREVWGFDGTRWRHLPDAPRGRLGSGLAYDPDHQRMLVLGGYCDSAIVNDCSPMNGMAQAVLALSTTTDPPAWSVLDAPWDDAVALADLTGVYDPVAHVALAVGGSTALGEFSMTTHQFDGTQWSPHTPASPIGSYFPGAAWDPVSSSVFLLATDGSTWALHEGTWTQVIAASPSGPVGRDAPGFTYEPLRRRFLLTGGIATNGILDDVWELDPATLTWTELFVAGTSPLPRQSHAFAMHDRARAVVLRGGVNGSSQPQDDTWLLRFVSTTPDESCGNNVDDDGDLQVDADDPDCQ